jgi:alpha/beta superfamily hydrolase
MTAEQPTTIPAGPEALEAQLALPPGAQVGVVMCHPHPLYGGDMSSPVVTQVTETCAARGVAALRFNFRGVGASTGRHDGGRGERDDARACLEYLTSRLGSHARVALAGYSFGAAVAAAVAVTTRVAGLALIAPPLRVAELALPEPAPGPCLIVAGTEDQYCPTPALEALRGRLPGASVVVVDGADHFFLGSLVPLADAIGRWADALKRG